MPDENAPVSAESVSAFSENAPAPDESVLMRPVAHLYSDFPTKFGIPRQSGLVPELRARLVFTPPYRDPEALRGLEGFSHLWLLWQFSASRKEDWSPTVRPPRLGGNVRMGVFATRAPYRPNPLGLSCVQLVDILRETPQGPVLLLGGADLMDGTPVFDIKPYLPAVDSHPRATAGFAGGEGLYSAPDKPPLAVDCPPPLLQKLPEQRRAALLAVLAQDPRPAYQRDPARVYGFGFAGFEVRFTVREGRLTVQDIFPVTD